MPVDLGALGWFGKALTTRGRFKGTVAQSNGRSILHPYTLDWLVPVNGTPDIGTRQIDGSGQPLRKLP